MMDARQRSRKWNTDPLPGAERAAAPSTMLRMVPLPRRFATGEERGGLHQIRMPEHERRVGAAEAEGIAERDADIDIVAPRTQDRHVGKGRVQGFDVGAFAKET